MARYKKRHWARNVIILGVVAAGLLFKNPELFKAEASNILQQFVPVSEVQTDSNVQADYAPEMSWEQLGVYVHDGVLSYQGKDYRIASVDGGNTSGHREPDTAVDVGHDGNGYDRTYWGLTNEYSQLVYVLAADIVIQDDTIEDVNANGRYYDKVADVEGCGQKYNTDRGHVIADSLGGNSCAYNVTAQNSNLNRHGDQAYMEKVIRDAGGCTNFVATITYPDTTTMTPEWYHFEYDINGNHIVDDFPNADPEH